MVRVSVWWPGKGAMLRCAAVLSSFGLPGRVEEKGSRVMRQVTILPILIFQALLALPLAATVGFALVLRETAERIPLGGFLLFLAAVLMFLALVTLVYRVFLRFWPLPEGDLAIGSPGEFRYMVYIMFWLMIFLPVLRMSIIPVPLSGVVLRALGARVGAGSYSSGLIFDPHFVTIGSSTQIGFDAVLIPHAQARGELAHYPIRIGSNVTIGARSVIMAGATIEDGAIVGLCSLVTRGTHIRADEVWAGIPARPIRRAPSGET